MLRDFFFVLVFVLSAAFTACFGPERLSISSAHDLGQNADSNLMRVGEGDIFVIKTKILRPEIEGHTEFEVDAMTSDDPRVVSIRPGYARSEFIVEAVGAGETVLRATIDDDERAVQPIKVVPWGEMPVIRP